VVIDHLQLKFSTKASECINYSSKYVAILQWRFAFR